MIGRGNLPSLNALRAFQVAGELHNFSRAAEALGVTQGAISRQIRLLEGQLGIELFHRGATGVTLTLEGEKLLPVLTNCFQRMAEATAALRDDPWRLSIGAPPSFGMRWFMPRLARFQAENPRIDARLTITTDDITELSGFDVAVYYGATPPQGLQALKLAGERLIPVTAPRLIDGDRPLKSPADLARHTLIDTTEDRRYWRHWLQVVGLDKLTGEKAQVIAILDMALRIAEQGMGVAIGDVCMIADDIALGRLAAPFPVEVPSGQSYWLVTRPEAADRPKLRSLFRFMEKEARMTAALKLRPPTLT
ncbi:LysR substrate-binding domain-containing protein [Zavarzinia compransoris]|uniref:LysR substrate-binding domain-containing protein n=1 Tax=Zavarzinia marina TaxID=2911065 RepID=UPI001F198409|nr:LysR substrate-binding domain-containing protein [Zavarzinia marina]MCF4166932.1 LysR substrate-binding domain-containing protein [Zavarzinia marina]